MNKSRRTDWTEERRRDNFWQHVDKSGDCWTWCAALTQRGYGKLQWKNCTTTSHRIAWLLTYGGIPEGLCVLHVCDNRLCVRPEHLFLGTRTDNARDRDNKGRQARGASLAKCQEATRARGERVGTAKLNSNQVSAIRGLYIRGTTPLRVIAEQFNVSISTISLIIRDVYWRRS